MWLAHLEGRTPPRRKAEPEPATGEDIEGVCLLAGH
jgi:hypothetical protein